MTVLLNILNAETLFAVSFMSLYVQLAKVFWNIISKILKKL